MFSKAAGYNKGKTCRLHFFVEIGPIKLNSSFLARAMVF
jgi:hypothetical protein